MKTPKLESGRICYGIPRAVEDKARHTLRVEVDTAIPAEPFASAVPIESLRGEP